MSMLALIAPAIGALIFLSTANLASITTRRLRQKKIGLLIAHPDDEAMFFAPSILALADPKWHNTIYVLCLSNGDAEGIGELRAAELTKSCGMMGVKKENVRVLNNPAFPDSMTAEWDAAAISLELSHNFVPKFPKGKTPSIDMLLTFDPQGVSHHPNHTSLFYGAKEWCSNLKKQGQEVELYSLTTTSLWRKYLSVVDVFFTIIYLFINMVIFFLSGPKRIKSKARKGRQETKGLPFLFISTPWTWLLAQKTMTNAHVSQMKWFRWGWIFLSRYMIVNDMRAVPLD
jgi:N-acetylglucosaminylphosphatidylinositol deacetylase